MMHSHQQESPWGLRAALVAVALAVLLYAVPGLSSNRSAIRQLSEAVADIGSSLESHRAEVGDRFLVLEARMRTLAPTADSETATVRAEVRQRMAEIRARRESQ